MSRSRNRFLRKLYNSRVSKRRVLPKKKSLRFESLESKQMLSGTPFQLDYADMTIAASTHHGSSDVAGAFNGDGLNGDLHNNSFNDSWATVAANAAGKWWITVDLGGTYNLEHLKVWNGNAFALTHRGIKQGDIFIADDDLVDQNTGESNVAFDPTGWQEVISDQSFTKALYSSTTVGPSDPFIDLQGVEAAHLAIRVDSLYGGNRLTLSEIQIFASDATPATPFDLTVDLGTGDGSYLPGSSANIVADTAPTGQIFSGWTGSDAVNFGDVNSASTTFTMPAGDTTITANYVVETYDLTVDFGSGDGSYLPGESASLVADAPQPGQVFLAWAGSDASNFGDVNSASTTFTMPAGDATLTATYASVPFVLIVDLGTGDGSYLPGSSANIVADTAPTGQIFSGWTGSDAVNFGDVNSASTTFTMPAGDTTITANYVVETYDLTVDFGSGDGSYLPGESASLVADAPQPGQVFLAWAGSDASNFGDVNSASTTFTMPAGDATLTATYASVPFVLIVDLGTGDGSYLPGSSANIVADTAPTGQVFSGWTGSDASNFADANSATTTFTMPAVDTTLTATYASVGSSEVIPFSELTVTSSGNYPGGDIFDAFNGIGMTGDLHNNLWHEGWLSNGGGAAGEWIKVDLGGSYTLDSLEFWNGNQPGLTSRGIQQADIFVAQSDPGVNTNNSGLAFNETGWTPLITDQQFTQATGLANLPSTDTIGLSGTASFLAIRVDTSHGGGFVAVSEMQISRSTAATATSSLTVVSGSGSGVFEVGSDTPIAADEAPSGQVFSAWTGDVSGVADVNAASTIFTVQSADTTITANYVPITPFVLIVDLGTGDGTYLPGASANIVADAAPTGQIFAGWTGSAVSNFADANSSTTTFTMPAVDTTITATYAPVGTGNAVIPAGDLTVISSSQYSIADAAGAFDGSGLTGDQHNDVYTDGWLSGPTGAAGQWIIVDLGGTYTLDHLRAWNYNQPVFSGRGIEQADLYYSTSGVGNNTHLSGASFDGAGWNTLVNDQSFTQSPGGSSISNTDANIALPNVSASHLAIVVDSSFAGNFAGLAEMQIYAASSTGATPHNLTVDFGTGDGSYLLGESVTIAADTAPSGQVFSAWTGSIVSNFGDVNSPTTTFTMTDVDTTLTATYAPVGVGSEVIPFSELSVTSSGNYGGGEIAGAFNGDGLNGSNLHNSLWGDGWLSNGGGAAGEWIKVDLGGSYTLDSLEFWNGNQPGLTSRGIQQADIFVAQSDPGVNTNNSGLAFNETGWTPLITDQQFTQATGLANLPSTDTIGLGGTASFLAIRVDTSHGDGFVAVSEIQISRVPVLYGLDVTSGSGDGFYTAGTSVDILADAAPSGEIFLAWTGDVSYVADANASSTTFSMPAQGASITATYVAAGPFNLVVTGGSGDGSYTTGTPVAISAAAAPAGDVFFAWTGDTTNLDNVYDASTSLNMPAGDITLVATYATANTGAENLALHKAVTVSNEISSTQSGDDAVDGVTATHWRSLAPPAAGATPNPWLEVDLGQAYSHIDRVNLQYYMGAISYAAADYEIQYKLNSGDAWSVAHQETNGLRSHRMDNLFAPVTARYIRYYVNELSVLNQGLTLSEIQVYQSRPLQELIQRDNTPNVIQKLENGEDVKIAYMGGSITAQPGGYRDQSRDMFEAMYPTSTVTQFNSAVGGTGTAFALGRIDTLVAQNPDLVFIEFVVNDESLLSSYEDSVANMETLVRTIWEGDATTDIVFVSTFRQTFNHPSGDLDNVATLDAGYYQMSAAAFEEVADYYGIPTIHMGKDSAEKAALGQIIMEAPADSQNGTPVFSSDGIHPYITTGHVWYTEALERSFDEIKTVSGSFSHALPAPIRGGSSAFAASNGSDDSFLTGLTLESQQLSATDEALFLLEEPEEANESNGSLLSDPYTSSDLDDAFQQLGQQSQETEEDEDFGTLLVTSGLSV